MASTVPGSLLKRVKRRLRRVPGLLPVYQQALWLKMMLRDEFYDLQSAVNGALTRQEWDYTVPVQQQRYARVLTAVSRLRGEPPWGDVLEVGCAEGLFTEQLAQRSALVTVCDISPVACERAAKHCASYPHVSFHRLDIARDPIPGRYDLAFVMGVLEMMHGRRKLGRIAANLARAIKPGGLLAINDSFLPFDLEQRWWTRWLAEGGQNRVAFIDGREGFRRVSYEEFTDAGQSPGYLVALLERTRGKKG